MTHAVYEVETRDFLTQKRVVFLPYSNMQGEIGINKINEVRLEVPLFHPVVTKSNIYPLKHEIWIWRNGKQVFAGPLTTVQIDKQNMRLQLTAQSLLKHLEMRIMRPVFTVAGPLQPQHISFTGTAEDAAWFLINRAQLLPRGNMFISQGIHSGLGVSRSYIWPYQDSKKILTAITEDLARVSQPDSDTIVGFDFEITPDTRAFNTYYPNKGSDVSDKVVLEYGTNIKNYSISVYGSGTATFVGMRGAGDPPITESTEDVISSEIYGLRENSIDWRSSPTRDTLRDAARYNVGISKAPHEVLNLVVDDENLSVWENNPSLGDTIRVRIDDGYAQYDTLQRFIGFQFTAGSEDNETIVMYTNDLREIVGDSSASVPS